jgi:DNA gyrase subunit A
MEYVPGPDFPTGGVMLGRSGARKAYLEGRGSVIIRAKTRVEEIRKDRYAIVVDEIPYQVNKATMIEKIADLAREKKIEGIAHVQDESDRDRRARRDRAQARRHARGGAEPALPLHADADLLRLQHAGAERRPARAADAARISSPPSSISARKSSRGARPIELRKARERSHILCGLAVAVSNVDEVVATIRASADAAEAREKLMTRRWPAEDIAEYIAADRRSDPHDERGRHLQPVRDAGPRHPRSAPAAPDRSWA